MVCYIKISVNKTKILNINLDKKIISIYLSNYMIVQLIFLWKWTWDFRIAFFMQITVITWFFYKGNLILKAILNIWTISLVHKLIIFVINLDKILSFIIGASF